MKYFKDGIRTLDELKKEYRALSKAYHPDLGGSEKIMQEINMEYDKYKNNIFFACRTSTKYTETVSPKRKESPKKTTYTPYDKYTGKSWDKAQDKKEKKSYWNTPPKEKPKEVLDEYIPNSFSFFDGEKFVYADMLVHNNKREGHFLKTTFYIDKRGGGFKRADCYQGSNLTYTKAFKGVMDKLGIKVDDISKYELNRLYIWPGSGHGINLHWFTKDKKILPMYFLIEDFMDKNTVPLTKDQKATIVYVPSDYIEEFNRRVVAHFESFTEPDYQIFKTNMLDLCLEALVSFTMDQFKESFNCEFPDEIKSGAVRITSTEEKDYMRIPYTKYYTDRDACFACFDYKEVAKAAYNHNINSYDQITLIKNALGQTRDIVNEINEEFKRKMTEFEV